MEVYAELPKKLCAQIEEHGFFDLPSGVSLRRKKSSRCCYFDCANDEAVADLIDIMDTRGIPWRKN